MKRLWRDYSLSITLAGLFLLAWIERRLKSLEEAGEGGKSKAGSR